MRRRGVQIAEISTATVFAVMLLAVVAPSAGLLRLIVGLPLVFFLPGHALVSAFDPDRDLGGLERLTTSVALSISLTIGLGMAVALSPLPLSTGLCVLVLSAITLAGEALAIRRGAEQPGPDDKPLLSSADSRLLVPVVGSLVVIAILVATTVSGAAFRPSSGELVQLWMLPDSPRGGGGVNVGAVREISDASRFRPAVLAREPECVGHRVRPGAGRKPRVSAQTACRRHEHGAAVRGEADRRGRNEHSTLGDVVAAMMSDEAAPR